ncbi:uncharacterized protein [Setaria viridis]|uniref:uncharacterized protein n=1 Tax=Setaria viridis TaxID=4556 RepID=UPI0014932E2D|nr:uncharacterized protein LOC117835531 [Setaria viridis]
MDAYCVEVNKLEAHFDGLEFHHVPREHIVIADVLSKLSSKHAQVPVDMFLQVLRKPSIKILNLDDGRAPFIAFITDNMSSEDKAKHEKLARRSTNYVVISKELYRKAASTSLLMKYILHNEGLELLHEIHSVDKFTKWIEVKAITSIESAKATQFVEEFTHRFRFPNKIITDLGKQLTGFEFWDFCQDNLIDVYYSLEAHPRCNGQVERANGMVLQSLKSRIFDDTSKYTTKWLRE